MVDVEIGDAKRALHQLRADLEKRAVLGTAQAAAQATARRIEDRIPEALHAVQLPDFAAKLGLVDQKTLQQAEDRAANRGFVGGFLVGALVGAVLALIFAPRRGAETRDLIAHTASDVTERVASVVPGGDSVSEAIDSLKAKATDAAAKVSETIAQEKTEAEDAIAEAQDEVAEQADDAEARGEDAARDPDSTAG